MAYAADKRILLSHQDLVRQVRERVSRYARDEWMGMPNYQQADVERFIARVVPVVTSGQTRISQLTNAYLDAMARAAGVKPVAAVKVAAGTLRGVPLAEVYGRPAVAVYTALKGGKSLTEAVGEGAVRLDQLVQMDMQMAHTFAAREKFRGDERIVGYERVLDGGESCALCIIASTQRYHSEDLMPIHDRCGCTVAPIYGKRDPGQVINAERYDTMQELFKANGIEYTGGQFKTDRSVRVDLHGEYGPVLSWAGQHFTGPAGL